MTVIEDLYSNAFGIESHAQDLFDKAILKGIVDKGKSFFMRRKNTLLDIASLTRDKKVASSHYQGLRKVSIDRIKASEGRCDDFDICFHPLKSHTRQRWLGIACAVEKDAALPPVDLIKIGETYAVRDGHHRISVAKAYGASTVEAYVTEMEFCQEE